MMKPTFLRRRHRRGSEESGATVVEAALVTPLLFFLIFAIMEFGPLFFEWGSTRDAVSEGVRAASISGTETLADYRTVQSMRRTLKNLGPKLDYIIVYKAKNLRSGPPQVCLDMAKDNKDSQSLSAVGVFTAPPNTPADQLTPESYDWWSPRPPNATGEVIACNVYYRRMFDRPPIDWTYNKANVVANPASRSLDGNYPASSRIDFQSGPQDYLGVFVQSQYVSNTGLLPPRTIRHFGVIRIEPTRANR